MQTSASTASSGDRRSTNFILSKIPNEAIDHGDCNCVCAFPLNFCPVDRHNHFCGPSKRPADRTIIIRQRPMHRTLFILFRMLVVMSMTMRV